MGKGKAKRNIFMCIIALLFCATIMGVYAIYTSTESDNGNAKVAKFNITQEGTIFNTIEASLAPGTTQTVELIITNKSEIKVKYLVEVTNETKNIAPLQFNLTPQESAPSVTSQTMQNGKITFSALREAGNHIDKYNLEIYWEPSQNEDDDLALIGMVDYITIAVTAASAE